MDMFRYGCTALAGTNKVGDLKPDANGYRDVVLGGFNVFNSGRAFYSYGPSVRGLFENSSAFQRRVKRGSLFGECGHPKQFGLNLQQFMQRVMMIDETNVGHHIAEVWADDTLFRGADGQPIVTIMGKVKPEGPKAEALESLFQNPKANVCFSIRSLTDDKPIRGVMNKEVRTIITWDSVIEPGIAMANKWDCPSLESFAEDGQLIVTRDMLDILKARHEQVGMGIEDGGLFDQIIVDLGSRKPRAGELVVPLGGSLKWKA